MKILMLGNSFTYCNDLDKMLAERLGACVVRNVRGGARLSEQLNPATELGANAKKLFEEKWDYVVLQEMSRGPVTEKESFMQSVKELSSRARECGAKPLLYATWAYREGSEKLASTGLGYKEMTQALHDSYHEAAQIGGCLVADVGDAFYEMREKADELFVEDDYHPGVYGSGLAADVIAAVIREDVKNG